MTAGIGSVQSVRGSAVGSVRPRSARVSKLVSELRSLLEKGEPASARAYLEKYPDLQNDYDAVVDLGYEEYCQRLELGEEVNQKDFVAQFPRFRDDLARMIALHNGTEKVSEIEETLAKVDVWPRVGRDFGGYKLIRELGRGSFARVYYALETALGNRPVAVKVSKRIGPEADILGQLRHSNIVPIHSIRPEPSIGKSVVCMPYLGKTTLNDLLERAFSGRELPQSAAAIREVAKPAAWEPPADAKPVEQDTPSYIEGVLRVARQLAEALAFVHERNILHRDLKPSNVLLTADGRPMLLDFNLSVEEFDPTSEVGGTVEYMSPEMLRMVSKDYSGPPLLVDARSDIFSLGVILYELLAGVHPFGPLPPRGTTRCVRHLLHQHPIGPASLRVANPAVSERLAGIVEKCLASDPAQRFASAAELCRALGNCHSQFERAQDWLARHASRIKKAVLAAGIATIVVAAVLLNREPASVVNQREGMKALRADRYAEAIDYFSKALSSGGNAAEAYFGRGWAYLYSGQARQAREDFEKADALAGNGRTKASLAEALVRLDSWSGAAAHYEKAIEAGFETAPLLNNLAVCYLKKAETHSAAESCLQKALTRDASLRPAHHNLVTLALNRSARNPKRAEAGIAAAKEALALGEFSGFFYYDVACLFALSAKENATAGNEALKYIAKAVERGVPPRQIQNDPLLANCGPKAKLDEILRARSDRPAASRPSSLAKLDIRFE